MYASLYFQVMFHGRNFRNLSESNISILVISVSTFLKYSSGSKRLSLAVYISDDATALACAPSNVDEDNQFFLLIILSLTERSALLLDNSKCPFSKRVFLSWLRTYFLAFRSDDRTFVYCLMIFNKLQSCRYKFHLFANL